MCQIRARLLRDALTWQGHTRWSVEARGRLRGRTVEGLALAIADVLAGEATYPEELRPGPEEAPSGSAADRT